MLQEESVNLKRVFFRPVTFSGGGGGVLVNCLTGTSTLYELYRALCKSKGVSNMC